MASLPTQLFHPHVCIIAVDASPIDANSSPNSFVQSVQNSLNTFGDILALHSFKSLVSLVSLGPSNSMLFKLQKINIIQWRHSVAKLEADTNAVSKKAWIDFFASVQRAKDALARISSWNIVIFVSKPPTHLLDADIFKLVASLDQMGIHLKFVHISSHHPMSEVKSDQSSHCVSLNEWAQLEVIFKTSLCHSKMIRFSPSQLPSLEIFVKQLVGKLVTDNGNYHKSIELHLSESVSIRMRSRKLFYRIPRFTPFYSPIIPSLQTEEELTVSVGDYSAIKDVSAEILNTLNTVVLHPIQRVSRLEASSLVYDSLPISLESYKSPIQDNKTMIKELRSLSSLSSPHRLKTSVKTQCRDNSAQFGQLIRDLGSKNEVLLVWTFWDLENLDLLGKRAQNLHRRHYLLYPGTNGTLSAIGVISSDQTIGRDFSLVHHDLESSQSLETEDCILESLEVRLFLESIPTGALNPEEMESQLHSVMEAIVASSSSSTTHVYR